MAGQEDSLGHIVAFEGHAETVSTQLRLLPASPQLLILPGIQCYFADHGLESEFDVRSYIKTVHDAFLARDQAAQEFLQASTQDSKRLVFMNGGTPSAHALCIRAIMKHETDGDCTRAEAIFHRIMQDGMAGLDGAGSSWKGRATFEYWSKHPHDELEDPITRAMRAADALDRQTANLQPTNELDLTFVTRGRSNSLPLYGYADNFGDAAPFFVFGAPNPEDLDSSCDESPEDICISKPPRFSVARYSNRCDSIANHRSSSPVSPQCVGETYGPLPPLSAFGIEALRPGSEAFSIRSTDNVVYGEASLLDMRYSDRQDGIVRVKSLDRIYTVAPKYRDLCLPSEISEPEEQPHQQMPTEGRRHSCMIINNRKDSLPSRLSYIDGPRTIMVRSTHPTVKVAPVPMHKKRKPAETSYIDKGTDAESGTVLHPLPEPVFPLGESVVVYFQEAVPDALLDKTVKGFKKGTYPITPHQSSASEMDITSATVPDTPDSFASESHYTAMGYQGMGIETWGSDDYDPFTSLHPAPSKMRPLRTVPSVKVTRPPTPAETPPPTSQVSDTVLVFKLFGDQTAVVVQNRLRSLLKTHFPPETQGFCHFKLPLLPELDGIWKPIFREAEPGSPRENNGRVDQILAIGAQRGVEKKYTSIITGQLEKLGSKAEGISRSGKLDFRYLLANAMQAYTAQPLTSQAHDNPFANSYLLATLIIPHLETYLALHSEVRYLLLEYPPEHLPTMLALQKLVGVDLMKVAQIVDSRGKEPLPFTHIRGKSITNKPGIEHSNHFGKPLPSPPGTGSDITMSKANFLLTSSASDAEIATFISTVLKILTSVSNFYQPDEAPKKPSPRRARPQGTFSPFPKVRPGRQSPSPATPMSTRFNSASVSHGFHSRAPSADTARTSKSPKSKQSQTTARRRHMTVDGQSIMTMDLSDSEWDAEDRRLMPALVQRPDIRKNDSHKALRFLGLA